MNGLTYYVEHELRSLKLKVANSEETIAGQLDSFKRPVYWLYSEVMMLHKFYPTLSEYYDTRKAIADLLGYEAWLPGIGISSKEPSSE
jgi:hypothetical protein